MKIVRLVIIIIFFKEIVVAENYWPFSRTIPTYSLFEKEENEFTIGIDFGTLPSQFPEEGGLKMGIYGGYSYLFFPLKFQFIIAGWYGYYNLTVSPAPSYKKYIFSGHGLFKLGYNVKISNLWKINGGIWNGFAYDYYRFKEPIPDKNNLGEFTYVLRKEEHFPFLGGIFIGAFYVDTLRNWGAALEYFMGYGGGLALSIRVKNTTFSLRNQLMWLFNRNPSDVISQSISVAYILTFKKID